MRPNAQVSKRLPHGKLEHLLIPHSPAFERIRQVHTQRPQGLYHVTPTPTRGWPSGSKSTLPQPWVMLR